MKKALLIAALFSFLATHAQTYTLQDINRSLKSFGSHMIYLEGPRMLLGSYDTTELDGTYFKIVLQGELWSAGQHFGKLYQVISFDARDISNNVTVVPYTDPSGGVNRWDVVIKAKMNKNLIHFRNEQISLSNNTHFIRVHQDVPEIRFMFISEDAANRFRTIAKAVFKL